MGLNEFQALAQLIGVPMAVTIVILLLGSQGRWCFGRERDWLVQQLERERREKEHWRAVAERALGVAEKVAP